MQIPVIKFDVIYCTLSVTCRHQKQDRGRWFDQFKSVENVRAGFLQTESTPFCLDVQDSLARKITVKRELKERGPNFVLTFYSFSC
jgi:hypothetical protein